MPALNPFLMPNIHRATPGARALEALRIEKGSAGSSLEWVAEECPVTVSVNGSAVAVMMASPFMLEEFAAGFVLSEGILPDAGSIESIRCTHNAAEGYDVNLCASRLQAPCLCGAPAVGRTSGGRLGAARLASLERPIPSLPTTQTFDMSAYERALSYLKSAETVGAITGCTHAAAWVDSRGGLLGCSEDVGRHVALDKVLGLRALNGGAGSAIFVSSRASYEMVSKAARCGIEIFFAVSAPTELAVRLARKSGITLAAFSRPGRTTVYSRPDRLLKPDACTAGRSTSAQAAMSFQ